MTTLARILSFMLKQIILYFTISTTRNLSQNKCVHLLRLSQTHPYIHPFTHSPNANPSKCQSISKRQSIHPSIQEFESEQMRPLAKAVTKTLERVRSHLREQVFWNWSMIVDYMCCECVFHWSMIIVDVCCDYVFSFIHDRWWCEYVVQHLATPLRWRTG